MYFMAFITSETVRLLAGPTGAKTCTVPDRSKSRSSWIVSPGLDARLSPVSTSRGSPAWRATELRGGMSIQEVPVLLTSVTLSAQGVDAATSLSGELPAFRTVM